MPTEFCPSCRQPRTAAFRYCRGCGFDFDAATSPAATSPAATSPAATSPSQTQQLASAAKTVQNVSVATSLGGFIGLVVGVLVPGWLVFGVMTDPGLALLVPFTIGPIVGVVVGQRVTLAILSR